MTSTACAPAAPPSVATPEPDRIAQVVTDVCAEPVRCSWGLSPDGRHAACVLTTTRGTSLEVRHGSAVRTVAVDDLSPFSQLLVEDDGTVMLCRHREGGHLVQQVAPSGSVGTVCRTVGGGFWLAHAGADLLAVHTVGGKSTIHRLADGVLTELVALPHPVLGVAALGPGRLAVTVKPAGGTVALDVDLSTGATTTLFDLGERSDESVADVLPAAGLIVVATTATGTPRLGVGPVGGRVRFPEQLVGVQYLAGSPDGTRLAVTRDRGTSAEVALVDTADWSVRGVRPGRVDGAFTVHPRGALRDGRLTAVVTTVSGSGPAGFVPTSGVTTTHPTGEVVEAVVGGIPCLVHGDPTTAATVVIALHGGPASAWRVGPDPLLAALTRSGVAVVAANVRGSTGYGRDHQLATLGCWGGPDREDVHAVAEAVTALRPSRARRPVLLGASYGAWLALAAAGERPERYGCVVALSPFVSGARLVRAGGLHALLVTRLGGQTSPDLRDVCAGMPVPGLVVHGGRDEVIDAGESRVLAAALRESGVPVTHLELPNAGHDLVAAACRAEVLTHVLSFLSDPTTRGGDHR